MKNAKSKKKVAAKTAIKNIPSQIPEKPNRPTWDEYFMNIAEIVGTRATCDRGKTGCVVVKENRILATGYVGSPAGTPHCDEVGHEMHTVTHTDGTQSKHCIRTTHAEQNVIAQAARVGVALGGGTLYTHMVPCYVCAKMIINSGIKRVVAAYDYHAGSQTKKIFQIAKIDFTILNDKMEMYANQ